MLKLIRCVLTPHNWETIFEKVAPVTGMTTWQIRMNSPETNRIATYRGRKYEVSLAFIVAEIVTDDSWLEDVIRKVIEAQEEGLIIGQRLDVFPVEESYHIRNGFMDR
jgi:nitrogen regulatory protein PII